MSRHDAPAAPPADATTDIGAYCRAVEAHLCRVNGGHLVRIVGPAFELVAGWAREGVPLRVALHGVDRTITRLTAKGPRRRPVRIEFCEADVRDAFDQWRRAVGVHAAAAAAPSEVVSADADQPAATRGRSLPRHIERVLVRLSSVAAATELPPDLRQAIDRAIREVDARLDAARGARAEARTSIVADLQAVEAALTVAAVASLPAAIRADVDAQVARELAAYRAQLPAAAYREAEAALRGDLARKHFSLPQVRIDG
ncbi:hypothetical protein TBR22_A34070 [Luteitalea sp. TBR-22]|uniref:hypothetical protein n=1 Tax=Luteitalea sp. TBR-22 TaxID=2802971 RepID=UPI001AFAE18C|nr:hypothetical protein [Luteitalea sp. TBR-22]BCS34178.1 hypothetical protein TBR22_A34070 [Luteitalea sp. TBR-22]